MSYKYILGTGKKWFYFDHGNVTLTNDPDKATFFDTIVQVEAMATPGQMIQKVKVAVTLVLERKLQITERSLACIGGETDGVVRIFPPADPTNYGFWVPFSVVKKIFTQEQVEQIKENQETLYFEDITQEQIDLIVQEGINPFYKKTKQTD